MIDEADADLGRRGRGRRACAASWRRRSCRRPSVAAALATRDARRRVDHAACDSTIFGVEGIGEIHAGRRPRRPDRRRRRSRSRSRDGDVVVVTQKIVSKAEGRLVAVDPDDPLSHKPLVERESVRVLRRRGDLVISETKHGFVCANAGIDLSNVERG